MGKITAILLPILAVWAALAQIMPDIFQLRRDGWARQFLWGPRSIWVAVMAGGCLLGTYIWTLEERLATLAAISPNGARVSPADETGLHIVSWGPTPDGSGCHAVIDGSNLPARLRENFDLALV